MRRRGPGVTPSVELHIREGDRRAEVAVGPGKVALLEQIAETGSITLAAKKLGMSYRRAWLLVDETNRCLVGPAVITTSGGIHGGGTALTPLGLEFVRRYRAIEKQAKIAVSRNLGSILNPVASQKATRK
jgi:molybdate transport system regulatory protein